MSREIDATLRRDRRSSSIIMSAFRSLTARTKSPLNPQFSPASVADSSVSGLGTSLVGETNSTESRTLDLGDPIAPEDITEMQESVPDPDEDASKPAGGTLPATPQLLGAPPELVHLVTQLQVENPIAVRTQASYKICRFLEKFPVKEVLAIWTLGSDLRLDPSADAAQYGFELLVSCIKAAQLTATERKLFWESIYTYTGPGHLEIRLQAATTISENGKHIECMEGELAAFLSHILKMAFLKAVAMRKKQPKTIPDPKSDDEHMLSQVFQFITNVIKFNSITLKDSDFEIIIARLYSICSTTNTAHDISNSLEVISHLAIFTNISPRSFQPCLDLLCGIYKQVPRLKNPTWDVWKRVLESNLKSAAIVYLFSILRGTTGSPKKELTVQGAFYVLRDLAINDGQQGLPNISLSNLAPVMNTLLRDEARLNLEMDVLSFYQVILAEPAFRKRLIDDVDWMYFRESLTYCSTALQDSLNIRSQNLDGDSLQTPVKKHGDPNASEAGKLFIDIVQYLCDCFHELNVIHQEEAATLFFHLGSSLSNNAAQTLLTYLASRPFLTSRPLDDYFRIWKHLIGNYAQDTSRPVSLRRMTYEHLTGRFDEVQYLPESVVTDFTLLLVQDLDKESDIECLEVMAAFVAKALQSEHRGLLFEKVFNKVRKAIFYRQSTSATSSRRPSTSPASTKISSQPSLCRIVVRHIIRLFLGLINESAEHAEEVYRLILDVAGEHGLDADARICALKLLFRLRSTGEHRLYVAPISESESIAAVLCRTSDTAKPAFEDPHESTKETRSTGSIPTAKSKAINIKRTVPPLWFYPGPKALPSEPPKEPSLVLFAGPPPFPTLGKKIVVLKIAHWVEMVLSILQQPNVNWEVYSYVLVHLGSQLKNQMFFTMAIPHIKLLRSVICDHIRAQSFQDPPSYTSLRKADVAICLFHTLTMLISYHAHFAKSEEDELVRSFVLGIGSWDGTSKWCIHALSICCHELPMSVSRSLDGIIQKTSTTITRPGIAIHILEFLCGVARLPELYKNFTDEEFRTVFGVAFKYIQFVHDQRQKESEGSSRTALGAPKTKRYSDSIRELKQQTSDSNLRGKSASSTGRSDDLPQYVHALAYHVITFWFMALKLRDRPSFVQQIAKNLTYVDSNGKNAIEEQGLVTLDMMERIAYTDRDETMEQPDFAKPSDGEVSEKTWIVGMSLLTIQTAGRTGVSQITRRRPSGTHYAIYRPQLTSPPRHQVPVTNGLEADVFYTSSYIGVLPENVMQEMYAPLGLAAAPQPLREVPCLLPSNDDKVRRAITAFDRNSTVDGHKIGIIYVAEGQTQETQILANTYGSAAYTDFLRDLGSLVRLKGATFNTQGLDRSGDIDGQYAYCWRDRSTELVYHVTTMMPTNTTNDPNCTQKKSHIGNDFVNVIWNDSGEPFNFHTFPSQFNYVYIVITPELQASFTSQRQQPESLSSIANSPTHSAFNGNNEATAIATKLFYRIQVVSAPGFPSISPAAEAKLISARALAPFVRSLALNASYFSLVWSARDGGEIVSPWRNRLREIIRLRERYGATGMNETVGSVAGTPGANQGRSGSPLSVPPSSGGLLGTNSVHRTGSQRNSFMAD